MDEADNPDPGSVSRADPIRSLELLWGIRTPPTRGPKPGLTIDVIVNTAIAIADVDGLAGLSMRHVAERLDVGTMSLYRYIPAKAELLDLMFDRVSNETARPDHVAGGWRGRLDQIARENLALYERHPWLLDMAVLRPPLGPGVIAKYDFELRAIDGIGLSDVEMDSVLSLLLGYVQNAAALRAAWMRVPEDTGQTDDEWWLSIAPTLERVLDVERYAVAVRVGTAATDQYRGLHDPGQAFEFGLERVLDGIAVLIDQT
jgi:AcrR family transcriptional regulator